MLDIYQPDWTKKAHCLVSNTPTQYFFDLWEKGSKEVKAEIESICNNHCPVKSECLAFGMTTGSSGLFGGIYLEDGKPIRNKRNSRGFLEQKRDAKARDNRLQMSNSA